MWHFKKRNLCPLEMWLHLLTCLSNGCAAMHLKSVGHTKFSETFGDKFSEMKVGDKFHKFVEQFSDKLGFHKKVEL